MVPHGVIWSVSRTDADVFKTRRLGEKRAAKTRALTTNGQLGTNNGGGVELTEATNSGENNYGGRPIRAGMARSFKLGAHGTGLVKRAPPPEP
jgi:hypothetical protein